MGMSDISGKPAADRFRLAGIVLLVLFVVAGIIYSALLAPVARYTDEREYLTLSASLVHGSVFSMDGVLPTAERAPGYAFFLAALCLVGGDFITFRVAQFLLVGVTILLVARLCSGRQKCSQDLLIVTGLVICYPVLLLHERHALPANAGRAFSSSWPCRFWSPRRGSRESGTSVRGNFVWIRSFSPMPTFLLTMPVVLGSGRDLLKIVRWREAALVCDRRRRSWSSGSWTVRNADGTWTIGSSPLPPIPGLNLLEGNNPNADGGSGGQRRHAALL